MSEILKRLTEIYSEPFPRIEERNGHTLLLLAENVVMAIPPLTNPIGLGMFAWRLPPDLERDYFVALYRSSWPDFEPASAFFIYDLDQESRG